MGGKLIVKVGREHGRRVPRRLKAMGLGRLGFDEGKPLEIAPWAAVG